MLVEASGATVAREQQHGSDGGGVTNQALSLVEVWRMVVVASVVEVRKTKTSLTLKRIDHNN